MWLKVKSSLSSVNEVVELCVLALLILDEIGYLGQCEYLFYAHLPEEAGNLSNCVMLKRDVCEDG